MNAFQPTTDMFGAGGSSNPTKMGATSSQQPAATTTKPQLGPRLSVQRDAIFSLLKQLAIDNEVYFRQCAPSLYTTRMADSCEEIGKATDVIKDLVKQLQEASRKYDYDEHTPGNGLRSLVCVGDVVLLRLISTLKVCSEGRGSLMFRVSHYCKEVESFGAILRFLILAFHQVISMLGMLEKDSLFPPLDSEYSQYNGILRGIESLDASCFYGRPLGFQFCPTVTRIFRVIGLVLATYSLSWQTGTAAFGSLLHSGKLLLNPEQRAVHIIKVTREADIEFCRGFWNLSEIPMPKLFCPSLAVCEMRELQPCGPQPLESLDGSAIMIPEPSAHTGVRPVHMRILSLSQRVGLSPPSATNKLPLSPHLVIHCHGGGYVATSSKSHESYLRSWAKALKCPLVSIDYSLAPENPFPRPTEEVLYAYAWMLNNPEKIGWTGEKVCMVGDSAGGNLIISVNLRLVEMKAKRLPDGLVPIYTPFLFQYLPSPSRVLSFMDPLLHMGVVIRCAAAYTGSYTDEELDKNCTFYERTPSKGHKSLLEYVDQVQKAQRDNFLDFTHGSQSIVSLINLSQGKGRGNGQTAGILPSGTKIPRTEPAAAEGVSESASTQRMAKAAEELVTSTPVTIGAAALAAAAAAEPSEEEGDLDDTVDEEMDATAQTVRVDGDPFNICLSSTNVDQCLIDYLQLHPLTMKSIHKSEGEEQDDDYETADEEEPQAIVDNVFDNASEISNPVPRSHTTASISSMASSAPAAAKSFQELPRALDSNGKVRLTASAGRAPPPMQAKKKLTRHKGARSLSQSLSDVAELVAGHAYDNVSGWFDTPKNPVGHGDKEKLARAATMSAVKAAQIQQKEAESLHSHFTELLKLKLPRDYLMSPLYSPAEILCKLPPIRFVACHLDPLLDDTIMFAKRMRAAGGKVVSVDLLDSLPHGFLNFAPMSAECREGANICLSRIMETLDLKKTTPK